MKHRRGAVLIVVLGILVVLALLATTFATLQATERQVSRNYLDAVRAKLLAQSGVEDALARLTDLFPAGALEPGALASAWKYRGADLRMSRAPGAVPLEKALYPSFGHGFEAKAVSNPGSADAATTTVRIEGLPRGFSDAPGSGTYASFGDHYALRVTDLSGLIHVNDGLDGGPSGAVTQNLRRILNVLGGVLAPPVADLGTKIVDSRPLAGYSDIRELEGVLGGAFERVRPFLTAHAWVDRAVANPVPLSAALVAREPDLAPYARGRGEIFRLGSSKDAWGREIVGSLMTCPPAAPDDPSIRVYGLDTLNPQWIQIVSRAPVNVNSAPREVLVALLVGLKGFFLSDRRRNNPNYNFDPYFFFKQVKTLSPEGNDGDELGFLIQTLPIVAPGSTVSGGAVDAGVIADEIMACRGRKASANFDYAAVPWGGPFRTWRQFNAFADNLAKPKADGGAGVIVDPRPLFFDHAENTPDPTGDGPLVAPWQGLQRRHAARAVADVLKANFNPNLHLNELNPDENLFTLVDKTDLITHSTEFCFLPTGHIEVESLGRVLRPRGGFGDARLAPDNELVAQAKVAAVVKLYDLYRETNQKQFGAGSAGPQSGVLGTNNNRSLEVGPEPDNGPAARENEWGGYVALATIGGVFGGGHGAPEKPRGATARTVDLASAPHLNSAFHVHFTLDFDAHHHAIDRREIAARSQPDLPGETVMNFPDLALAESGPYDPTKGAPGDFRLARSTGGGGTLRPAAPSDLRIDGGYSERHAAPAYLTSTPGANLWNFTAERARGMVSFWMKPSYFPELTGKMRMPWDLSKYHERCDKGVHVFPFAVWFFPTQFDPSISEYLAPEYWSGRGMGRLRPCSLGYGSINWHLDNWQEEMHSFGNFTSSLNHVGHADESFAPSPLRAHRWLNVTFLWSLQGDWEPQGTRTSQLYVNGQRATFNAATIDPTWPYGSGRDKILYWERHDGGDFNHIRLGGPSKIGTAPGVPYRGNHSADATLDEVYVWRSEEDAEPQTLWSFGRYYIPRDANYEGIFTSGAFALEASGARALPPPTGSAGAPPAVPASRVRALGLAWTWHGEGLGPDGKPVLYDYHSDPAGRDVRPRVRLGLLDGGVSVGGPALEDDGFSPVRASDGSVPLLRDPRQVRYRAQFRLEGSVDPLNTVLLATPVLDDVTVFWDDGGPRLLSYVFDHRSF